jgi:hypothetical protein
MTPAECRDEIRRILGVDDENLEDLERWLVNIRDAYRDPQVAKWLVPLNGRERRRLEKKLSRIRVLLLDPDFERLNDELLCDASLEDVEEWNRHALDACLEDQEKRIKTRYEYRKRFLAQAALLVYRKLTNQRATAERNFRWIMMSILDLADVHTERRNINRLINEVIVEQNKIVKDEKLRDLIFAQ